jgi:hypothetical protein
MKQFYLAYYNDKLCILCNGDFLDEEEIIEMLHYYYIDFVLYDHVDLIYLEPYPYPKYPLKFLLLITGDLNRFSAFFDLNCLYVDNDIYPHFKLPLQSYPKLNYVIQTKMQEEELFHQMKTLQLDF